MSHSAAPSRSRLFVLRPSGTAADLAAPLLDELVADGVVLEAQRLRSHHPAWGLRVPGTALKAGWERVRQALGRGFLLAPAGGNARTGYGYPTGRICVRREGGLTPEFLEDLSKRHRLTFLGMAPFAGNAQARFEPLDLDTAYLPDLCRALVREPGVDAAWLEAEMAYHRS